MIRFFTNLDEAKSYVGTVPWKGPIPAVGHSIEYRVHESFVFRLQVVAVTHSSDGSDARVEMHLGGEHPGWSIRDWAEWFKGRKERRSLAQQESPT